MKDVEIAYETLEGAPFTPPYGDIHHRTQTLRGISDPSIGVDWMPRASVMFGAGLSLPIGSSAAARSAERRNGGIAANG